MYKICPNCKTKKHESKFHKRTEDGKQYLKSYCKECCKILKYNEKDLCACGQEKQKRSKTCKKCNDQVKYKFLDKSHKYRGNCIRSRARTAMQHIKECQYCGYNKHVEVCHIKPIKSFPSNTLIDTINDPSNLLVLCPNCHWEFDNQKIK